MNEHDSDRDFEWLLKMLALEEERGSIVPGGAVGGGLARARHKAEGQARPSAAERARKNMRFLALALSSEDESNKDEKAA
ncbi:MAG: hypothetical protein QM820_10055 [Minicystis sp.]